MNPFEREKLTRFLQQLAQAQIGAKDEEAEKLIGETCRLQKDATYLLVQRSLLMEQALENAQAEIARLRSAQEESRASPGSFLGNNAWGSAPVSAPSTARSPVQSPAAPVAAAAAGSSFPGAGFLGTVASTAAGVVAGSFLFQGIGHLLGNHGNSSGFLSGNNSPTPLASEYSETTVVNNDYDSGSTASDLDTTTLADLDPDFI